MGAQHAFPALLEGIRKQGGPLGIHQFGQKELAQLIGFGEDRGIRESRTKRRNGIFVGDVYPVPPMPGIIFYAHYNEDMNQLGFDGPWGEEAAREILEDDANHIVSNVPFALDLLRVGGGEG